MPKTSQDELQRELLGLFVAEAREQLRSLNREVVEIEKAGDLRPRPETLDQMMREAHNLKGAAAAMRQHGIRDLAHHLETIFTRISTGERRRDPTVFDVVYQALDAVSSLVRAAEGHERSVIDVTSLSARLQSVAEDVRAPEAPTAGGTDAADGSATEAGAPRPRQWTPEPPAPSQPPSPAPAAPRPGAEREARTVRVASERLDGVMAQLDELLAVRLSLEQHTAALDVLAGDLDRWAARRPNARPDDLEAAVAEGAARAQTTRERVTALSRALATDGRRMDHVAGDLREDVRRVRMLPLSLLFEGFPRMVRDLARRNGKEVDLRLSGGDTEVDRSVLEEIRAPLTHLLRNAVDHGLETPRVRLGRHKAREGALTLSASQHGASLVVEVADDGGGVDRELVRDSCVRKGLLRADEAGELSDGEILRMIFSSGLSTSNELTEVSGRGVGLDVVREAVHRLNGIVDVESTPGEGTRFRLTVPLSVATTHCLLVSAGGQTLAVPVASVVRIVCSDEVRRIGGRDAIVVDGEPLALLGLMDVVGTGDAGLRHPRRPVLVLGSADLRRAFVVDAVVRTQDLVVKGLPPPLEHILVVAGAAILGTGEPVVILNVGRLLSAQGPERTTPLPDVAESAPRRILVVDDSIAARSIQRSILEAAGYAVRVAADGLEAWNALTSGDCDLLVSDIRMPGMDGLELTKRVRTDRRLQNLPVVLVTSLDSPDDRREGLEAGADAYIGKGAFDERELLQTIEQLVP